MHKVELLAEAFNLDSLKLNIENGCDAVYIGDELKNFSIDELKKSVEYAHNRDKKVYVSLNKLLAINPQGIATSLGTNSLPFTENFFSIS